MPGQQNYETPLDVYLMIESWHGPFTVDAAATELNSKCRRYYDEELNALDPIHDWSGERVWCNPPYAKIYQWIENAVRTVREQQARWTFLLPNSTDTKWWHDFVWDKEAEAFRPGVRVHFWEGRISFIDPDTGKPMTSNDRANVVVHFS